MRIGIDIDNTLTTGNRFNQLIEKHIPGFKVLNHYDEYPIEKSLKRHGFINNENDFDYLKFLTDNLDYLYNEEEIFEGSSKAINEMKKLGHEIFFITARSAHLETHTKNLLEINNIECNNLFHLGSYDKTVLANEKGINLFIEDNTSNIENLLKFSCVEKAIIISSSYNKLHFLNNKDVTRLDNWLTMVDVVEDLDKLIGRARNRNNK